MYVIMFFQSLCHNLTESAIPDQDVESRVCLMNDYHLRQNLMKPDYSMECNLYYI